MMLLVLQRDTFGAQPRKPWSSARVMGTKGQREYNNAMAQPWSGHCDPASCARKSTAFSGGL